MKSAASAAEPKHDEEEVKLYPNCDASVWLRSCEQEVLEPLAGTLTGEIPPWLRGELIRNGPGSLRVGDTSFKHLFDSSALLHRFHISGGAVSYQCRFVCSRALRRNRAARRVVVPEFGTAATPDPCNTIFHRMSVLFNPSDAISDNTMISVYPFGDQLYAFTEGPIIHRIEPRSLATLERRDMSRCAALVNHTSHPHVMPNGDVYNVGMSFKKGRIRHLVVKFPYKEKGDMFEDAQVVASMKPRSPLHPAYMHSFVTPSYFVLVEQPLSVSLAGAARGALRGDPLRAALRWAPDKETHIVLLSRATGREAGRHRAPPLFFLHVVNAFERGAHLVLDLCAYKDAAVIDAMYVHAMENMQTNASYAEWFRARPQRFVLPLDGAGAGAGEGASRGVGEGASRGAGDGASRGAGDGASRGAGEGGRVLPTLLADVGCETPRIHYERYNGLPYRYFYAISSDVDAENPGTLIKVDTELGAVATWSEPGVYPSEPVFVPAPDPQSEDDGVLLSALVWGGGGGAGEGEDRGLERRVALLVLHATDLRELARTTYDLPSPAPKCLHGWFLPKK